MFALRDSDDRRRSGESYKDYKNLLQHIIPKKVRLTPLTEFFSQLLIFDQITHANEGNKIRALEKLPLLFTSFQRQ